MDEMVYVKFINSKIGYGTFAKKNLPKNTVLGEYTGFVINNRNIDHVYTFPYFSHFKD